ncbi:hypothetical protein QWZ04_12620 [Vibrio tapetis subsp. quintayensis]|uniref:hypothetical protein n=1 Tax=Vibrio tapetis TaxID=52443 RepID=UPI0025B3D072|nr:hypothetical protein [Vibrio tapetis]MDN3681166.1 hypothetical protein [Vibrio tapetis subsp. quintayensis]
MKRASSTYRLQLIKEVAIRNQRLHSNDPMASYIQHLIDHKPEQEEHAERNQRFSGCHFDEGVGGWVSDSWDMK